MIKLPKPRLGRDFWGLLLPAIAIVVAAFWIAFQFVQPAPPKKVVMSGGAEGGAYDGYAGQYRDLLKAEGIELELRRSAGSVENLKRLMDGNSGVSIAFVQGGVANEGDDEELMSLASLYYEPLWVFYRGPEIDRVSRLRGRRIAVGPRGSGTRPLALQVLALAGLNARNSTLLELDANASADALVRGRIDAAMIVADTTSPQVARLLHEHGVRLMSFAQAEALTRHLSFLSHVVLPEGGMDFAANLPPRDVHLVAPTANLVVRDDIHPALVSLLMQAATEIHGGAGLLRKPGDFPSDKGLDIAMSLDAERYLKSGPPFLQRHLPFWLAVFIDRMVVMLVPVLAVMIPLVRFTPTVYAWRIKSRIYRWYGKLKVLEVDMEKGGSAAELRALRERLDDIEQSVSHIATPLAFSEYLYNLRSHVDLVRARLDKLARSAG
ncbi:MAG TPA: TAXI family TRAP transporter solute-binding subunit [Burkholderiales bacterium]|nr:TAXI family TRAP transporter solute-binding subunit [Burkholderiales bacterium]